MKDEEHYISVSYGFQIIEDVQTETSEYFEWAESTFGYSVNGLKKHISPQRQKPVVQLKVDQLFHV